MTEASLKPGWTKVKFGEVVRLCKDRSSDPEADGIERYVGLEHLEPEDLRIRNWGLVAEGTTFTSRFKPGQVLFGKRRPYLKKAAVADFEGVCSGDIYVFESSDPDFLLPKLLPFICQTDRFFDYAVKTSAGSLSPRTNWTSLRDFEVNLPPIEEQAKIACVLDQNQSLFEYLINALEQSLRLRIAVRKKAFSEGFKERKQKDVKIGKIPSNWDLKPLEEVFDFLDNKRVPLKEGDRKKRSGSYPYYGASGPIDSIDDYIFDEPTLLLAEDGMNLVFRNSPIVYKATGKYWVNNHAHVLKPKSNTNIDFYLEYLEHISYLPYVTGTYQKKITQSDCLTIPVVFPPVDEQEEIVNIFQKMDSQEKQIRKRISESSSLGKSILAEVMS